MRSTPLDVFHCPLGGTRLIEASAGTGKTWNICGLYLRLLLELGLDVQRILVVTFTNAATAELRERIRSRIAETLAQLGGSGPAAADPFVDTLLQTLRRTHGLADDTLVLRLESALRAFDEASIFTIHGFCQRALADAPFTAGMPMALELLRDDAEMQLEVVHDFWRRRVSTSAPALAAHLIGCKDSPQRHALLLKRQLAKPLAQLLWPEALDAPPVAMDTDALQAAHAAARELWQRERDAIVTSVSDALPRLNGSSYRADTVRQAAASWDDLLADRDALGANGRRQKLDLLCAATLRTKTKKGQTPPEPHPFFDRAETLLALRDAASQTLALERLRLLRELLTDGPAALRRAKRERRVIAFDDMLHNLHERLTGGDHPALAASLKARFPAALIDEFQDTDPLQFAIFKTIYQDGSSPLFLVGDPKQAIYSFRNADLHTYLQARDEATAAYSLAENQRSTRELLAALNALFGVNPQAFMLPRLAYHPVGCGARPRAAFTDGSEARAPLQLWTLPRDDQGGLLPKPQARAAAAQACAAEIARLLNAAQRGEVVLDGVPLAAGDIAVLVRSHAQGGEMRRALAALGVGSVELSQASVYDSTDAEELERVLAAVLEPARERLLRAALATALLGLDAAAIEAVSADEARWLAFVTRFAGYRDAWLLRGVGVMLRALMAGEAVAERMLARPDGARRLTNLLHLAECLHEAAESHAAPEALLRWLQAQRAERRGDDAAQLRLESDRCLVQIVTVHKSKGLEYPVVFCPFLWDGHPGGSPSQLEGREFHDDAGRQVLDFRILDERSGSGRAAAAAIRAQQALERAAENLRLIYVALTRAVQRCYLVVGAYSNKAGKSTTSTECSRGRLNWLVAGAGQSPADWLSNRLAPEAIDAAWAAFAGRNAPQVGLAALPQGTATPLQRTPTAPEAIAALAAPRRIPPGWSMGSYSSLTHGARHEGAAVDHDLRIVDPQEPDTAPASVVDADDILRFPRGAAAGDCVHAVFERIDFTDPTGWPGAIDNALRRHPQPASGDAAAALQPRMLARMLADVLQAPLPGGFSLAELPRSRCLVELEFSLPSRQFGAAPLSGVLHEHGYPVPTLAFGNLSGYLRGFIDLVFEWGGRYHVLDWKSNHLGERPDDYTPAALARVMDRQGYHLQYLLYTVALHRYLQLRLPDYRYERHVGGALYLFVRGLRPGWTDGDGAACGVYAHRPSLRVIEQLSALLESMRERA